MPIRIACCTSAGLTTLRIEGRLVWQELQILREEYARHPGPVRLDLSELHDADRESAAELRRLLQDRAILWRATPYLALLLQPKPPEDGGPTQSHHQRGVRAHE